MKDSLNEGNEGMTPIVYLDIHINKERVDRITLYHGHNPDEAIQRFAMKNFLTQSDIEKIRKTLMDQVPEAFNYESSACLF